MKKFLILIFIFIVLLFALSGCMYPEYKNLGSSPEKGHMIDINGIKFKSLPETLWQPVYYETTQIGSVRDPAIGETGRQMLFTYDADVNKIFVKGYYDTISLFDLGLSPVNYYRDDFIFPAFDSSSIDTIGFIKGYEDKFSNVTKDMGTIKKLFILKNSAHTKSPIFSALAGQIFFMNSKFEGIGISLPVYVSESLFWIFFEENDDCVEIPHDLLEEIAGIKLPTASEIEQENNAPAEIVKKTINSFGRKRRKKLQASGEMAQIQ